MLKYRLFLPSSVPFGSLLAAALSSTGSNTKVAPQL
jgi:hypothetical protein